MRTIGLCVLVLGGSVIAGQVLFGPVGAAVAGIVAIVFLLQP